MRKVCFIYIYIFFFEKPYAKVNSLANFCEFTSRKSFSFQNILTVINLIMASLRFIGLPQNFRSLLDTKALGPPLIYLIGPLSISDPHINICVGPPNSCNALKQFNLLPPNTMFWTNFIDSPLKHQFQAITLGWIKTETWVINKFITYSTPRTFEFKSCPVFPLWPESSIKVWLTDRQERDR